MPSLTLEQALNAAIHLQRAHRLDEAEKVLRQILAQHSDCADALHLLGVLCAQRGQLDEAASLIRRAITIAPNVSEYHLNLGNALFQLGQLENAISSYRAAADLQPNLAAAWSALANGLREKRNYSEAIPIAKKALELQPQSPDAIAVYADLLRESGHADEAIAQYQKALALRPGTPEFHNNLSLALTTRRRLDESLTAIDQAIALRPNWPQAWSNRADTLRELGRLDDAIASARRALGIAPNLPEAHINLAGSLMDQGNIDTALESARRAVELAPQISAAHNVLSNILKEAGAVSEAVGELDRAIALAPGDAAIYSNKVYLLEFDPESTPQSLLAEQRTWNDRHAKPLVKLIRPHVNDRSSNRRLRIGYVSPYFHRHAESFFVVPLLESHDPAQVEVYCYSDSQHTDAITERLQRAAHAWRETTGQTPNELANRIRADHIDVLIDLTMHMAHNRALVFSQKPAPIQAAWLAYPGGMGLDAIDYRITDPFIDPLGVSDSHYHEQSLRLPRSWVCYDPLAETPPPTDRAPGPICFGSLNNPCKLNDPLLELWAKVLRAAPDSNLLLQTLSEFQRLHITRYMESHGVHSTRLQFAPRRSRDEYLNLYRRIDICLDPLPYNGITTSLDALWMGVPIVSLAGRTAAGRAGKSILCNIGLNELATNDPDTFVQAAIALAADLPRLAHLRKTLRHRLEESPLMDGPAFARAMESAYRQMWRTWCESPNP